MSKIVTELNPPNPSPKRKDGNTDIAASGLNDEVSVFLNTNPTKPTIDDEFVLTGYTSVNLHVTDKYGSSASILANAIAGADYFQKDCDLDSALDDRVYNFNAFPGRYLVGVTLRPDADPGDDWALGIRIDGSMEVFAQGSMKGPLTSSDDTTYFIVTDSLPVLCQPIDDSCLCKDTLTFFWNQIEGTSQYHFQLDDDGDFGSPAIDSLAVADTSLSVTSSLSGEEYYWRVRSNGDVWSIFSETYSFFPYLCGDINGDCATDLGDVLHLISYLYKGGPAPVCELSEDVNCDGTKDLGDVLYLISYLYKGGPAPPTCD